MHQQLIQYFNSIMPLNEEEIVAIAETIEVKHFKKGAILLREGQVSHEAYFVLEGCVRQYYIVDGEEKINNFFTANQWVVSINSFSQQTPASHFLDCCLDSSLVVGNRQKEEGLYHKFPKFETISRKIMEKVWAEQQAIMATYLTDSPEQRYVKLMESRPELLQKIPQYQIASYIGVKPESLSRIRKRLTKTTKD